MSANPIGVFSAGSAVSSFDELRTTLSLVEGSAVNVVILQTLFRRTV
jgi:hypothetical protein